MAVYRETDGSIVREYALLEKEPLIQIRSSRAVIDLVPTKEFGLCLFLDNELQFAEKDEYIYHEALVHPCLAIADSRSSICIIGGGDGCAIREVLKWSDVQSVDLIDWDTTVVQLFQNHYARINANSLKDSRLRIQPVSIQECIHETRNYDCIVVDLLDPDFSKDFQEDLWYDVLFLAKQWRNPTGCIVLNLGGVFPWQTETLDRMLSLLKSRIDLPLCLYKVFVPSFGREWCFALLGSNRFTLQQELPKGLKYLNNLSWTTATQWSPDYKLHLNPIYNS